MILVVFSVWIDYFKGIMTAQTGKVDKLLGNQRLAIGEEREFNQTRKLLTWLMVLELGGLEIAIEGARNFRDLLHSDRDFDPFVRYFGLRVAD